MTGPLVDEYPGEDQGASPTGAMLGSRARLEAGFTVPNDDLCGLLETLGIKLFFRERSLAQYVSWAVQTGVIAFLDRHGLADLKQVADGTCLTEAGADSILGVMSSLKLTRRTVAGKYELQTLAREYLLPSSPYCIADQIEARGLPIPLPYLKGRSGLLTRLRLRLLTLNPALRYGSLARLTNQHARNLAACASAVRTGEFAQIRTMVDIAGGSGTFSIPLALDYPRVRILLVDLPQALNGTRRLLSSHGLQERISLTAFDVLKRPWNIEPCDGMFMGNFLHGFDDAVCLDVLEEAYARLQNGGQVWIHEMLWNDTRDGPLIVALYHAAMRSAGPGRQRSAGDFAALLNRAGFSDVRIVPTAGAYALVAGRKS
jgi:hypothetical protein